MRTPSKTQTRSTPQNHTNLERAYKVGVAIKGFDGLVEFSAGLFLLLAPGTLHHLLSFTADKLRGSHSLAFLASHVDKTNHDLAHGTLLVVVAFLLSHGIIKLVLVYCLLREILWTYPYALGVLVLFLAYQAYLLIRSPGVGMALFALLDAVIIVLVWREWQVLKLQKNRPAEATD